MNISRPRRARASQPRISIKRTFYTGTWSWATTTTADFWKYQTFTAGSMPSIGEFQAVFDEYKVNAIKVTYRPNYDNVPVGTGTLPVATMHVCVDPASTLVPSGIYSSTNLNSFLENSGVRSYNLNKPVSIYFRPKVSDGAFGGGTAAMVKPSPWIKTSETSVDLRGYHAFIAQNNFSALNTNVKLDTFVTFYMSFKNLR